jgi:hypothetical protein
LKYVRVWADVSDNKRGVINCQKCTSHEKTVRRDTNGLPFLGLPTIKVGYC